jgi:hypothetical protein
MRLQTYGDDERVVVNDNGVSQSAMVMDLCPVIYLAGQRIHEREHAQRWGQSIRWNIQEDSF